MLDLIEQLQQARVDWQPTKNSPYTFEALFCGKQVLLRLNDFPEEPLCTVIFDNHEQDLDDFPKSWTLPRHRQKNEGNGAYQ